MNIPLIECKSLLYYYMNAGKQLLYKGLKSFICLISIFRLISTNFICNLVLNPFLNPQQSSTNTNQANYIFLQKDFLTFLFPIKGTTQQKSLYKFRAILHKMLSNGQEP